MWWGQMENEPSLTIKLIKYKTFSITAKIYKHYTMWCKEIGAFVGGKYVIQEGERHYSEAWYYSLLVLDQNKWHTIYIIHSDDFITFYTKLFSLPRKWRGGHKHWDGKSSLQMRWGKMLYFWKGWQLFCTTISRKKGVLFSLWLWGWLVHVCSEIVYLEQIPEQISPGNMFGPVADEERWLVVTNIGCHESRN